MKYKQQGVMLETTLDEIGKRKSLKRIDGEGAESFKKRLKINNKNPPNPSLKYYNTNIANRLAVSENVVFQIELVEDQIDKDDLPKIEIDAVFFRLWKNRSKEPVLEFNLHLEENKFMYTLREALLQFPFILVREIEYEGEERCKELMISSSEGYVEGVRFANSNFHNLGKKYITKMSTGNPIFTEVSKDSVEEVKEEGDYYLDKINGYLYLYRSLDGFSTLFYEDFPFEVKLCGVKCYELNDKSIDYIIKDTEINEKGEKVHSLINSFGGMLVNKTLEDTRLYWGK